MSTGDTANRAQGQQAAPNGPQRNGETWRNDPIWGGWSSYQGADAEQEGTVKIPEKEYKQFIAWKEFLEARKRFLDLIRLDVENNGAMNSGQAQRNQPINVPPQQYPPSWGPYPPYYGQYPPGYYQNGPWNQNDIQQRRPGW